MLGSVCVAQGFGFVHWTTPRSSPLFVTDQNSFLAEDREVFVHDGLENSVTIILQGWVSFVVSPQS